MVKVLFELDELVHVPLNVFQMSTCKGIVIVGAASMIRALIPTCINSTIEKRQEGETEHQNRKDTTNYSRPMIFCSKNNKNRHV